jgi:hypothetical protein
VFVAKVVSVHLKGFPEPIIVDNVDVIDTTGGDLALHATGNTGVSARFRFDRVIDWSIVSEDRIGSPH